jgi:hypothetical protein
MQKTCKECASFHDCQDNAISWFFLFIGLVATIAIRVVNLVWEISLFWAKFSWYVGVGGFFLYFLYKYYQQRTRRKFLLESGLAQKLKAGNLPTKEESQFLSALLCELRSRKDSINYFFIFLTSGLALLLGVYQDFLR